MPATTYSPAARVGRTLLSAAFDLGVVLEPFIRVEGLANSKATSKAADRSVRSTLAEAEKATLN
jgi:hypothetical protein